MAQNRHPGRMARVEHIERKREMKDRFYRTRVKVYITRIRDEFPGVVVAIGIPPNA